MKKYLGPRRRFLLLLSYKNVHRNHGLQNWIKIKFGDDAKTPRQKLVRRILKNYFSKFMKQDLLQVNYTVSSKLNRMQKQCE